MTPLIRELIFWAGAAICIAAQLRIIRDTFVSARSASATGTEPIPGMDDGTTQTRGSQTMEVVWAIVPAVALTIVLVLTWRAMHSIDQAPGSVAALLRAGGLPSP